MRRWLWLVLALCSGTSQGREMADNSAISSYYCMATAVYFEARGEPFKGKVAIRDVVNNRGTNTCSVVFQRQQFSWAHQMDWAHIEKFLRGEPKLSEREQLAWEEAQKAVGADFVVLGPEYKHFHSVHVRPKWSKPGVRIGLHNFVKGVK